jgi:hypothetical protein
MNVIKISKRVFLDTKQINELNKDGLIPENKQEGLNEVMAEIGVGLAAHSKEFIKLQEFFAQKMPTLVLKFCSIAPEPFDKELKKTHKSKNEFKAAD